MTIAVDRNMKKKDAFQIIKAFNKKDNAYTTHTRSVESFEGFLKQCKRAINKAQQIPNASVRDEFFSMYAIEQANRFFKNAFHNLWNPQSELYKQKLKEYESIKKMSNWEYLRKYGELHVQDGWFCVDFEFGEMVFAGLSEKALIEMEVFTNEECRQYTDAIVSVS